MTTVNTSQIASAPLLIFSCLDFSDIQAVDKNMTVYTFKEAQRPLFLLYFLKLVSVTVATNSPSSAILYIIT